MATEPDPYRTLGLPRTASLTEVKAAYRRLAKANHPDTAGEAADKAKSAGDSAGDATKSAADKAGQTADDAAKKGADKSKDAAKGAGDKAKEMSQ